MPAEVVIQKTESKGALSSEVVNRIVRRSRGSHGFCFDDAIGRGVKSEGDMSVQFVIGEDGMGKSAEVLSSDIAEDALKRCVENVFNHSAFPKPETGTVTVTQRLSFRQSPASPPARDMILTRIHMRYSKDGLGEDLVLREAKPIEGGRERRNEKGGLEQGALLSGRNNFQARYIIRHPWTGPIACAEPIRNRWGGPLGNPTDPSAARGAEGARDLAFVPRGAGLNTFLAVALPPVGGPSEKPQYMPPPAPPTACPSLGCKRCSISPRAI